MMRRKKKGRKSFSKTIRNHVASHTEVEAEIGKTLKDTAKTPGSVNQQRSARLSTLDEESSGDEFEVYGGKAPVPGFTKLTKNEVESSSVITSEHSDAFVGTDNTDAHQNNDSDTDSNLEEEVQMLTDRYGFIYNATDADIRLLRQARKASAPAPATLTGIKVGIRARGGTDSQSDDDKNDLDLNTTDSEDETSVFRHTGDEQAGRSGEEAPQRAFIRFAQSTRPSRGSASQRDLPTVFLQRRVQGERENKAGKEDQEWVILSIQRSEKITPRCKWPRFDLKHCTAAIDTAQRYA
jgi:hypothetical protein